MIPRHDHIFYGRQVACYNDNGFIVDGHDRRAWAAVSAMLGCCRVTSVRGDDVIVRWVRFAVTCGCTEDQHAQHLDAMHTWECDCDDECDHFGLPPCSDEYTWMIEPASEGTPGAVPILEVT